MIPPFKPTPVALAVRLLCARTARHGHMWWHYLAENDRLRERAAKPVTAPAATGRT